MISCVCLTIPGREKFLKRAIDCFRRQTYSEKALIIVGDPGMDLIYLAELAPEALLIVPDEKLTVGAKRNLGCEWAAGEFIAVWDDDDYSAPIRLQRQRGLLGMGDCAVTCLEQAYFTNADCKQWWLSPKGWIDTSLFFKRSFWQRHKFTNVMIGQDADFIRAAVAEQEFFCGGNPRWMFATNHPGNTCDRACMYGAENALKDFTWKDPQ